MSKLAWHFQTIPDWAKQGWVNSPYVKLIDPPNDNPFPGKRVIGRVYIPDDQTNAMVAQGAAGAQTWIDSVRSVIISRDYVYAWELPNEPQPVANYQFCQQLAAFTKYAASAMHMIGRKVIGGCLAEGNPGGSTEEERANLFCAIADGLQYCDYWSQHAYWIPDGYKHPEAGYNQWHALRYQMNREYARRRGIKLPPVMLTEGGYDGGIVGRPKQGWVYFATWPKYFDDLKRFDKDLLADPGVECCTLFVSGANWDWTSFEIGEGESKELAAYISCPPCPQTPEPQPNPTFTLARPLPASRGTIAQVFGEDIPKYSKKGFAGHEGLDYACPVGTKVLASERGKVKFAGMGIGANAPYGLYIVIDHGEFETWYCHLSTITVKAGDAVTQGQVIGGTGNSGDTTGPHLHYAVRVPKARNGSKGFVDPWAIRVILGDA